MRVVIGSPTGTLVQSGPNLSDGSAAWGSHTGTYTVPAGQTVTRFGFQAVSSAGASPPSATSSTTSRSEPGRACSQPSR